MNPDEKSKLIIELTSQLKASQDRDRRSEERAESLARDMQQMMRIQLELNAEIRSLRQQLTDYHAIVRENASLKEELRLAKKHRLDAKHLSAGTKNERDNRSASK